jgi:hypothetical protein
MVRIPQVGEPPTHRPSWLKQNYPALKPEQWGIVREQLYTVSLPARLDNWPYKDDWESNPVRAKWFFQGKVYVTTPENDGKIITWRDGTKIEIDWTGFSPEWLTPILQNCNCKLELLLCRGCQCGGA